MSFDPEDRLAAAMREAVGTRPYTPDFDQIESRGRKMKTRRIALTTGGATFAVAAIAAVAVATTGTGSQAPSTSVAAPAPAVSSTASTEGGPLVQLVDYLNTVKVGEGDATLILRDQVTGGKTIDVWDLHADNGDYYFAKTKAGLPAQVSGKHLQQDEAGRIAAVAAAKAAAKGDLTAARKKMALAYEPAHPKVAPTILAPGVVPSLSAGEQKKLKITGGTAGNITDNWVWNNSMDALTTGGGDASVRAGVLRLLGQMPEVSIGKSTLKGEAVITLTAGSIATGDSGQTLTIDAKTGLPVKFVTKGATINYTLTRVTIADVAKGKF